MFPSRAVDTVTRNTRCTSTQANHVPTHPDVPHFRALQIFPTRHPNSRKKRRLYPRTLIYFSSSSQPPSWKLFPRDRRFATGCATHVDQGSIDCHWSARLSHLIANQDDDNYCIPPTHTQSCCTYFDDPFSPLHHDTSLHPGNNHKSPRCTSSAQGLDSLACRCRVSWVV